MARRTSARRAALGIRRCLACGYCGYFAQVATRFSARQRSSGDETSDRRGDDPSDRVDGGESNLVPLEGRGFGHCPRCGCDFAERPPRSYAEMEGIELGARPAAPVDAQTLESRMVERWLAFLFVVIIGAAIAVGLVTQLLAPVVTPGVG